MISGDIEWRLSRAEEILSKSEEWRYWHEKQFIRALAEKLTPVSKSKADAHNQARTFVRYTMPEVFGEIDFSQCLTREEFQGHVDFWAGYLLKEK